ncbi:MAG: hypothetical protein U0L18_05370 [Acutalibacteraceae bacterium]|nr:hypothetical protein [Acutalibacteraceae bacterium]
MNNKITDTELSMLLNNATAIDYEDRLHMLAISLFTWKGLDDIAGFGASHFIEESLYRYGKACIVNDDEIGIKALNVTAAGKLNIYYLPVKVNAFSTGYNKIYDFDDVVYIMNNELQKPTKDTLTLFAARLYETERTSDVNLQAQKTPVLIEGDKNVLLTLKNTYMQYSGNMPVIYGNKNFDVSSKLNVLRTDAPYIVDKLEDHKHNLWNDCMTFLGINNANTSKKERLVTSEVESNDQLINYYLNCFYKTRKKACDILNEKFGTNVEIVLNKEVVDLLAKTTEALEKEGGDSGKVYDNNTNSTEK